jgi:hypothetical protein
VENENDDLLKKLDEMIEKNTAEIESWNRLLESLKKKLAEDHRGREQPNQDNPDNPKE